VVLRLLGVYRRRRAMACREVVALLTDYLDGALAPHDARRLEEHLAGCPHCSEYLDQFRAAIAAAGRVDPDELAPEVVDDLVLLYRAWRT
jgi:anti-sigma factor (TIGR02949 family)